MKDTLDIVGYLVLDEGLPLKDTGGETSYRFHNWPNSISAIALFESLNTARRVKLMIQRKYRKLANEFDPLTQAHAHSIWKKRAESLRVKRVGRSYFYTGALALLLAVGFGSARAQKPVDFALYAADATIRTLDVTSTHALLASPCRCFGEDNPLAPHTAQIAPLVAFQAGMSYGAIAGGRHLAAHGHPRLGHLLLLADIAGEIWAVQHNYRQHEPAAQPVLTPQQRGWTAQ